MRFSVRWAVTGLMLGATACNVTLDSGPPVSATGGGAAATGGSYGVDGGTGGGAAGNVTVDSGAGGAVEAGETSSDAGAGWDATSSSDGAVDGSFCYGDETLGLPPADAGALCSTLPYAGQSCPGDSLPHTVAEDNCDFYAAYGRPGVFEAVFAKLYALSSTANACSREAVVDATREVADYSCTVANDTVTLDSGVAWGCAQLVASCPWTALGDGGGIGIGEWECRNWVDRFRSEHRAYAFGCYAAKTVDATTCRTAFADCLFNWEY